MSLFLDVSDSIKGIFNGREIFNQKRKALKRERERERETLRERERERERKKVNTHLLFKVRKIFFPFLRSILMQTMD